MSPDERTRVLASLPDTGRRIARLAVADEIVWLKDFKLPSPSKWEKVQRAAARTTGLELLLPVPSLQGDKGAAHEIEAIRRFRAIGIRVPEVLWSEGGRVALSDIGETLREIESRGGGDAIRRIALSAAEDLSHAHRSGLAHGRPILRNMTWEGKSVGFQNFEGQPLAIMSLPAAQARDIVLVLVSLGRRNGGDVVKEVFERYATGMNHAVGEELQRLVRIARPLMASPKSLVFKIGNRDMAGIVRMLDAITR